MLHINIPTKLKDNSQEVEKVKCLPTEEWINKLGYIHIAEYYIVIKRIKYQHTQKYTRTLNALCQNKEYRQKAT